MKCKTVFKSTVLALSLFLVACDLGTGSEDPVKLNVPSWLIGEWKPADFSDVGQHFYYKYLSDGTIFEKVVTDGVEDQYNAVLTSDAAYTELASNDTLFQYRNGEGQFEQNFTHKKLTDTSFVRSVTNGGSTSPMILDTMILMQ